MKLMIEEKESQVQNITKQLHCSEFKCQKLQVIFDSIFKFKKKIAGRSPQAAKAAPYS
jgi:cytochrome c-type biogenesis protein CcmH/NrfF